MSEFQSTFECAWPPTMKGLNKPMRSLRHLCTLSIATIFATALSVGNPVFAEKRNETPPTQKRLNSDTEKRVNKTREKKTEEKRKSVLQDARIAVRETENALKLLDENKPEQALKALERATGKIEIILARDPNLSLAPAGIYTVTYDVLADIDAVNALRKQVQRAMEKGRLQEARHLIKNLASETVISVTSIPLVTYPDAIKLAAKYIARNQINEAKRLLQTALSTLVVTETIIPLPIVAAERLLEQAKVLAEKSNRTEAENKLLTESLRKARQELEFAEALGYGTEEDFRNVYREIENIGEKTEGGKSETGLFASIKEYLENMVSALQPKSDTQGNDKEGAKAGNGNGNENKK